MLRISGFHTRAHGKLVTCKYTGKVTAYIDKIKCIA